MIAPAKRLEGGTTSAQKGLSPNCPSEFAIRVEHEKEDSLWIRTYAHHLAEKLGSFHCHWTSLSVVEM
jgi:hypothetical protein